ncbi:hypothetical protein BRADI_1g36776v3 [Brachypodium distachyon]|uniref:Uncharacterized protein n=2 Tax=Brachypodium distachyon TaxID=15368 RepID=A0A2K2DN45_BRADI|nr:hypothetical protein BRADI_1g36776v3 [Brachypodium distachyon]
MREPSIWPEGQHKMANNELLTVGPAYFWRCQHFSRDLLCVKNGDEDGQRGKGTKLVKIHPIPTITNHNADTAISQARTPRLPVHARQPLRTGATATPASLPSDPRAPGSRKFKDPPPGARPRQREMRRSSSGARVSEGGDASSSSSTVGHHGDDTALPTFDPLSAAGRREAARVRELGRAVHCIPLLLLLCALVLWLSAAASPVLLD